MVRLATEPPQLRVSKAQAAARGSVGFIGATGGRSQRGQQPQRRALRGGGGCVCVCVPECVVVSHIVLSSQRTFTFTCRFGAAVWNSLRT